MKESKITFKEIRTGILRKRNASFWDLLKITGRQHLYKKVQGKTPPEIVKAKGTDDLTNIEGVGAKIASLLATAGLGTFEKLAASNKEEIQKVLDAAGKKYSVHTPDTWSDQAKLAANGKWEELEKWKLELKGGKE